MSAADQDAIANGVLTRWKLDDVQAEFSQAEQLIAALSILVEDLDESCTGHRRRQLDALIGVVRAVEAQMEFAQNAFGDLFRLQAGNGGEA